MARFSNDKGLSVLGIATAGFLLSFAAAPAERQAAGFQRGTPQVATDGVKPVGRQGRVSRESLSIAACRARAARHGEARFKELRLAGRHTYLVTGTVLPNRSERRLHSDRRGHGPWTFSCTVRGEGEIVAFKVGPPRR